MHNHCVLLAAGAQAQEPTAPTATPSVADAARAARDRQNSMPPKHVMTDDDVAPKRGAAGLAAMAASEQQVRSEMEKHYPASLAAPDRKQQISQMESIAASGDADMLVAFMVRIATDGNPATRMSRQ